MPTNNNIIAISKHQFTQSKQLQLLHQNKQIDKLIQQINRLLNIGTIFNDQSTKIIHKYKYIYQLIHQYLGKDQGYPKDWYVSRSNQFTSTGVYMHKDLIKTKYEGIVEMQLGQMWQLCMDINGYKQWMPFCTSAILKQSISQLQKQVYLKFKIPLLNQRFIYLWMMGIDRLYYNGSLVIYCEGISQQYTHLYKQSPINLKHLLIEIKHQGIKLRVRTYGEVQIKIGLLPMWVIKLIVKQITNTMIKRLNTFGNRKLTNNQKLSPIINQAIMKYLNKL